MIGDSIYFFHCVLSENFRLKIWNCSTSEFLIFSFLLIGCQCYGEQRGDLCYFHNFCPLHTDEESRNSVPDDNHNNPIHPRRRRNQRKSKHRIIDNEFDDNGVLTETTNSSNSKKQKRSGRKRKRSKDEEDSDHYATPKSNKRKKRKMKHSKDDQHEEEGSHESEHEESEESKYSAYSSQSQTRLPFRSPDVRKRKLEHSAPVILCSKLNESQIDSWDDFKEKFGAIATFIPQWKPNVTHLVTTCSAVEDKRILKARTIKYFEAVVAGCWVVCFEWIERCLEKNTLIDESPFEVLGDFKGRGGCRMSRELRRKKHDDGLFSDVIVVIASEFKFPKLAEDLKTIFRMGGAKILKLMPYAWLKDVDRYKAEMKGRTLVFVYDEGEYDMTRKQKDFVQRFGVQAIGYQQVFDSISNYKPLSNLILQGAED